MHCAKQEPSRPASHYLIPQLSHCLFFYPGEARTSATSPGGWSQRRHRCGHRNAGTVFRLVAIATVIFSQFYNFFILLVFANFISDLYLMRHSETLLCVNETLSLTWRAGGKGQCLRENWVSPRRYFHFSFFFFKVKCIAFAFESSLSPTHGKSILLKARGYALSIAQILYHDEYHVMSEETHIAPVVGSFLIINCVIYFIWLLYYYFLTAFLPRCKLRWEYRCVLPVLGNKIKRQGRKCY